MSMFPSFPVGPFEDNGGNTDGASPPPTEQGRGHGGMVHHRPPTRPASDSMLSTTAHNNDNLSDSSHRVVQRQASKPESLYKVATTNSVREQMRDRLNLRPRQENLHQLYESQVPKPGLHREDATVGQVVEDRGRSQFRATSMYANFPSNTANGGVEQSLVGSIATFFPGAPQNSHLSSAKPTSSNFASLNPSTIPSIVPNDRNLLSRATQTTNRDSFAYRMLLQQSLETQTEIIRQLDRQVTKALPAEPSYQNNSHFKDLLPKASTQSARSSTITTTTDGASSYVTANDGSQVSSTGLLAPPLSNIIPPGNGTRLSPISDRSEPSTIEITPFSINGRFPRRVHIANCEGSPQGREARNANAATPQTGRGRSTSYSLIPKISPVHISQATMRPEIVEDGDLDRRLSVPLTAQFFETRLQERSPTESEPAAASPINFNKTEQSRRSDKYNCGPTVRYAKDAHEVIMGVPKDVDEKASKVLGLSQSNTFASSSRVQIKREEQEEEVARPRKREPHPVFRTTTHVTARPMPPAKQSFGSMIADRLARPTASSRAREAASREENSARESGKGLKTKVTSLMSSRSRNASRPSLPSRTVETARALTPRRVNGGDRVVSQLLTTYNDSGMDNRLSQIVQRPYVTTPDLSEFITGEDPVEHPSSVDRAHRRSLSDGPSRHETKELEKKEKATKKGTGLLGGARSRFHRRKAPTTTAVPVPEPSGPAEPAEGPTNAGLSTAMAVVSVGSSAELSEEMLTSAEASINTIVELARDRPMNEEMRRNIADIVTMLGNSITASREVRIRLVQETDAQLRLSSRVQALAEMAVAEARSHRSSNAATREAGTQTD
ncbi:hypothetical protein HYFRA_00002241 [Hymenoscyphus fraxineus]|uniref:Uncharacterized protein n=1 Tax=Hymenoscyphus fraxineus TaxID=746836 RepID=A0A9N9KNA5_9HELO|nr:hypothetical protein HYFRA_00002241 [Hymenoscyphus fraxineus]